jgi:8-oxo-dGTP pyrophosphatase MutT (NUDIX family)
MKTDLVVSAYIFHNNNLLLIHHKKLNMWLPVGGHIEKDETPDEALLREAREEVNLDVEILSEANLLPGANCKKVLANPFHVNVHTVKDHDHCCFFYACKAKNPENLVINKAEVEDFRWASKEELSSPDISLDVKNIGLRAFEVFEKLTG